MSYKITSEFQFLLQNPGKEPYSTLNHLIYTVHFSCKLYSTANQNKTHSQIKLPENHTLRCVTYPDGLKDGTTLLLVLRHYTLLGVLKLLLLIDSSMKIKPNFQRT